MKKFFKTLLLVIVMLPMVVFFPGCNCGKNSGDDGLNSYPVMFYTDSGDANSFNYETVIVKHGYKVARPKDPTRKGYSFGGWYKDAELTITWKFDDDRIYGPTTIWAKWIEIESGNL